MTDLQLRPTAEGQDAEQQSQHRQSPPELPKLGVRGTVRYLWSQLTSMRTALVLLFALAVAAIPGSLVPQRTTSPFRVQDFIAQHKVLGPLYDRLGLFHVYTSAWFSAIYLLLFLSLIGCIIPRVAVYTRALRSHPPRTPRNLARLPAYTSARIEPGSEPPTGILDAAATELKRQHYRVVSTADSVSAERGYLREAGNLVFHVSLLVLLLGVAVGALFGFRGTSVVVTGQAFANVMTQYDDFSAGAAFRDDDLVPFRVGVQKFDVRFETGRVQRGAARKFEADVEVTDRPGAKPVSAKLEVNHPLKISGTTVHLIGHGYAPVVTVRDGQGNVAFSGPVPFLPQDGNFTSAGVVKVPDARPQRLAFEGFFTPTAIDGRGPTSAFPDALIPMLYLNAWSGPPRVETGQPENVYSLNTRGMQQLHNADGSVVAMRLSPGDTFKLPGSQGSVKLDGYARWVKLQVGNAPGSAISLSAIAFAVLGLCLSLFIRPRRVWVRLQGKDDGTTLVEVAGLDRADARAGLTDDVAELAEHLTTDRGPAEGEGVSSSSPTRSSSKTSAESSEQ